MSKLNYSIWFWQQIVTPHMTGLATALVRRGFKVTYVANQILSKERIRLGWQMPDLGKVNLRLAKSKDIVIRHALNAPKNSIHFCQGLRGNGLVGDAQLILRKRGLKHWAMLETIDDSGLLGFIKKVIYRIIFFHWRRHLTGVLAIGHNAADWFTERGMKKNRIYPFAYFLKEPMINSSLKFSIKDKKESLFRFIFVGELINLKKVDNLINAIAKLQLNTIELWIVGDGPEKKRLYSLANLLLPGKVRWFGVLPNKQISNVILQADCLVLPSRYDGWGAVVSEALMVGTPAICSHKCGSSVIVKASKVGSIFYTNKKNSLVNSLRNQYKKGPIDFNERKKVMKWARCLGSNAGAKYLESILNHENNKLNLIKLPWN
jgi:glycosyltransferase involved in cell wall biosynthesis